MAFLVGVGVGPGVGEYRITGVQEYRITGVQEYSKGLKGSLGNHILKILSKIIVWFSLMAAQIIFNFLTHKHTHTNSQKRFTEILKH